MIAIIEIPQGSIYKYEVDKEYGGLTLDRPLNQPVPYNYGYIPNTLCEDGDPLDVFVVTEKPILALAKVKIVLIAVLKCTDNGESDDKIIARLEGENVSEIGIASIGQYLSTYKQGFTVDSLGLLEEADKVYVESVIAYSKKNPHA